MKPAAVSGSNANQSAPPENKSGTPKPAEQAAEDKQQQPQQQQPQQVPMQNSPQQQQVGLHSVLSLI